MPYLRTAFFTAALSYLGFWFLDYRAPGFVSNVFSVHLIGLLALVFGVAWGQVAQDEFRASRWLPWALGLLAAIPVWDLGAAFGDFRALLTLGVFLLPWLTTKLLNA